MTSNKIYLISPTNAESGALETLPNTDGMTILTNDELVASNIRFAKDDKVCITSEASIEIAKSHIDDESKVNAIDLLKDKYKFRGLLKKIYPDYQYSSVMLDEIENLYIHKKSVLKPSKGCFGTAVKIIDQNSDMKTIKIEIIAEINKNSSVLSEDVLSKNQFLLEDFIDGEEYAVDMFYDSKGEPHIVNIYYHPIPKIEAYLHMVYYTSKGVFDEIHDKAILFFKELNKILKVKNFSLHSEFKYDKQMLFPIEINALRYGGMGLGNMIYYSVGLNPYDHFNKETTPNWKEIWAKSENANSIYAFFIAYNGTTIDKDNFEPNIEKLEDQFTKVLNKEIFDYKEQLAFGIFTIKENSENLDKLLKIDFNDYFKKCSTTRT